MAVTAFQLCARALVKIGAHPISSFDEGSVEAQVAASLYPVVRDALLSIHPWNFAIKQERLAKLTSPPVADFAHAFALPSDCLRVISSGRPDRGRGLTYRIQGQMLYTNSDAVVLTYLCKVDEAGFPVFFQLALIARLAAEFCIPLTESTARWINLSRAAEEELRRARLADAQEDTPPRIENFVLIEVRG
ncbi:MAG: hypothetical protein EA405_07905 [Rhodospirillales bacterium]|nr:MAG: hypothetical protein EA405_07905 [Rhodospirillales bacterium]